MIIGIDASRAARQQRTGVEEYTYQIIRHLAKIDKQNKYRLYTDRVLPRSLMTVLPGNFEVRVLPFFRLWTQIRLAWELLIHPPDIFWVPASAMPVLHPVNTIVTIHGLEFAYWPTAYTSWQRWYLKFSTKQAVAKSRRLIVVSHNTKNDLIRLYKAKPEKIRVVYNGHNRYSPVSDWRGLLSKYDLSDKGYFIFIGRLEKRKNVARLVEAFNLFAKQSKEAKLVLVGKPGAGFQQIKALIRNSPINRRIILTKYLAYPELFALIAHARGLVYPSLYEGFGIPILDGLAMGIPVICSQTSSLPEVGGEAVLYCDPKSAPDIAQKLQMIWQGKWQPDQRKVIAQLQKFTWKRSAAQVQGILTEVE
ncbi:glycosyltransferase family 4 protein [Patescibacteria group bacterium]